MEADGSGSDPIVALFGRAARDRDRGAAEIELALLDELVQLAAPLDPAALASGGRLLEAGQPFMANLRRLAEIAHEGDPIRFRSWAQERRDRLRSLDRSLAAAAWPTLQRRRRIVTVSKSSAVRHCVLGAMARGWRGDVVVLDGGRGDLGRVLAEELRSEGVVARGQPDASAPGWLDEPGAVVLVGADAVSDRRFVNAAGTRLVLELARLRQIPALLAHDVGKRVPDAVISEMMEEIAPAAENGDDDRWRPFEAVPLGLVNVRIEAG